MALLNWRRGKRHAEADAAVAVVRPEPVAARGAAAPGEVTPAAAIVVLLLAQALLFVDTQHSFVNIYRE